MLTRFFILFFLKICVTTSYPQRGKTVSFKNYHPQTIGIEYFNYFFVYQVNYSGISCHPFDDVYWHFASVKYSLGFCFCFHFSKTLKFLALGRNMSFCFVFACYFNGKIFRQFTTFFAVVVASSYTKYILIVLFMGFKTYSNSLYDIN